MKYKDLRIEIQKHWNTKVNVMPIIVGSLVATSMNMAIHPMEIHGKHNSTALIK